MRALNSVEFSREEQSGKKGVVSGIRSMFESQLYPMLPLGTWTWYLTSMSFSSMICKMGLINLMWVSRRGNEVCRKKGHLLVLSKKSWLGR